MMARHFFYSNGWTPPSASRRILFAAVCFPFAAALVVFAKTPDAFAAPKELRYKEMPLDLRSGDRLIISGVKAQVRVKQSDAAAFGATLRASKFLPDKASAESAEQFEALTFAIKRDGSNLLVEEKGPTTKPAWEAWLKSTDRPELVLEIEASAVPVEIHIQEGTIDIQKWTQSVTASVISGKMKTKDTEGLLRLQVQKGAVEISRHKGNAEVDSFSAPLIVQTLEGSLDLTNFAGETNLAGIQGRVEMLAHAGATNIRQSSGSFEFTNGRGALSLASFDGQVRGKTDQGAVALNVEGEAEVDVDSQQGNVAVRLPANSGAVLQLHTEEGGIVAPEDIRTNITSTHRSAAGRLEGDGPKGVVVVKSKSGAIRVR
jgi:DUF4097 and DUF4098 domain-containing protein YvlB